MKQRSSKSTPYTYYDDWRLSVCRAIYMSGFSFRDPPLDTASLTCKHHQQNIRRSQLNPKPFIRPSRCRVRGMVFIVVAMLLLLLLSGASIVDGCDIEKISSWSPKKEFSAGMIDRKSRNWLSAIFFAETSQQQQHSTIIIYISAFEKM